MEQHIKTRLACHGVSVTRQAVSFAPLEVACLLLTGFAVALLTCLALSFLLSQSAVHWMTFGRCLSAESRWAQAGAPQQIVSFNERHQGTHIEAAVTRQNPPLSAVADSKRGRPVRQSPVCPAYSIHDCRYRRGIAVGHLCRWAHLLHHPDPKPIRPAMRRLNECR